MANFYGIDEKGLEDLKGILQRYYKTADKILDQMNTSVSMNNAFKGEQLQKAVRTYIAAVKKEGSEWLSQILRYCTDIDTRLSEIKKEQTKLESSLASSSKKVSSQVNGYSYGGVGSNAS